MSADRIQTTHVGSLPRPDDLAKLLLAQDKGEAVDAAAMRARIDAAVREVVAQQVACGIDHVSDGELGKVSYVNYLKHRLAGFGESAPLEWTPQDIAERPEYQAKPKKALKEDDPPACRGPVSVRDRAPLEADLAAFRAAVDAARPLGAFMNAASPGVVAQFMPNRYYPTHEAYVEALAEALTDEYEAIHAAGFTLQIDCPDLAMSRHMAFAGKPVEDFQKFAAHGVEALNHATRNIPSEAMRLHICWGNYPGPHSHDVPVQDIANIVFRARPRTILFEAANARHAHEWEVWRDLDIPEDIILCPGMIDSVSNIVEHPRLIAQNLLRYADIVGRERVMAGTDCGFATFAGAQRVWTSVAWDKLRALSEGAAMASEILWKR
jgi:5-methyltetrahydropteroyltriglutamate--homocysteine methyltransferase